MDSVQYRHTKIRINSVNLVLYSLDVTDKILIRDLVILAEVMEQGLLLLK